MSNITIKGIVLSSINYKESSKIVYLYTNIGKISVRALGSKKQKRGLLPFITTMNYVEAIITDTEFPTLIDYTLISSYDEIKNDIKSNLWHSYMLELLSKIDDNLYAERIFNLTINMFDRNDINPMLKGIMYQTKMLLPLGVRPILKKCSQCEKEDVKYFNISAGGALCESCNCSKSYDKEILNLMTRLYYFDIKNDDINIFNECDLFKIFEVLNLYYKTHTHITLKGLNSLIF